MAIQAQFYSENFDGFAHQDSSLMENACGFDNSCFVPQRQQQQLMTTTQFDHQYENNVSLQKNPIFLAADNTNSMSFDQHSSLGFPHSFSAHMEKQRLEFDQFINLQNERLRLAMQEQRKQQTALLMKKCESKTRFLLKQKDQEIANAANRTTELQNFLKRIEIENLTWQRLARENEAMVASLSGTIQRLRESAACSPAANDAEDAGSCCNNGGEEREEEEEKIRKRKRVCRCCNFRNCSVILLPCRHLCCCKECEVILDSCPICRMGKKASVEALI